MVMKRIFRVFAQITKRLPSENKPTTKVQVIKAQDAEPKPTPKIESGYVFDSCVLRNFDEYEECVGYVLKMLSPMPYHVTSTIRREVHNKERLCNARFIKINFDDVKGRLEKTLREKISYNELSPEMINAARILRSGLSLLHSGDDEILAFTAITKSTLVTSDKDLMECCRKIDCKYINLDSLVQNSDLVCQMPYQFQKHGPSPLYHHQFP